MKNNILLILSLYSFFASSQVFDVDTLLFNGANRINLVILPDGYQTAELPQFTIDVNNILNKLLLEKPYS
jgi:hypothetical protein